MTTAIQELCCHVAGGIELEYATAGPPDGAPIVLLHGLFDHWRSFTPVMPYLEDVRAYAVTQRGHTGSTPEPGTIADLAQDAVAFPDAMGIERATLAGHSLGALAALQAATVSPERVDALVLAPGFATANAVPAVHELRHAVSAMGEALDREFVEAIQEQAREPHLPDGFFQTMLDATLRMPAAVCRALLDAIVAFDVECDLARVTAPALLLWGDEDEIVPRAQQDVLAANLPHADLRILPGCGHTPHWDDPEGVADALTRFVRRRTVP